MAKRVLSLLLALSLSPFLWAQTQSLQVLYVTKDYTTEVNSLCEMLKDIYSTSVSDPSQAVVFYVPNSTHPLVVKINLPDDNRKDFDKVIDVLMTKSETYINPGFDLQHLVSFFDNCELRDNYGNKTFFNVELSYFVTPTFWELQYNEQIIASAFFALDMDSEWAKDYLTMSIYHYADDGLTLDSEKPFGAKNLCHNYKFFLLTY